MPYFDVVVFLSLAENCRKLNVEIFCYIETDCARFKLSILLSGLQHQHSDILTLLTFTLFICCIKLNSFYFASKIQPI